MAYNTADYPLVGNIESAIRQGIAAGIVVDADFASDKATTLANIAARTASLTPNTWPLYLAVVKAVELGFGIIGSTVMITDSAGIYAEVPGEWAPGFSPVM